MQTASRRRWPWVVGVGTLGVFVAANLLGPRLGDIVWTGTFSLIVSSFVVVGAVLASRVPGNPIGPLLLLAGALLATAFAVGTFGSVAATMRGVPLGIIATAGMVNDLGFVVPIVIILIGIPLVFPDGHLLSPRWRWVVVLAVAAITCASIATILRPGPIGEATANPFAQPGLAPLAHALDTFATSSAVVGFGAAVLAVVLRYRRGDETERHQLKWLIAVAVVAASSLSLAFGLPNTLIGDSGFLVGLLAMAALPVAIGVAVLRYRLYEIDRIVSRTIAWAIVSTLVGGAFVLLVVALQGALADVMQGQTLAVAVSTLAAVALFQPVRRVIQRAVDRRFDRAGYDARDTADAFAERVRDGVDLDVIAADLRGTVVAALRPSSARVWLPRRGPS